MVHLITAIYFRYEMLIVKGLRNAVVSVANSELLEDMPEWGLCAKGVDLWYPPWKPIKICLRSLSSMPTCLQS